MTHFLVGLFLALVVAGLAYRFGILSRSGALAAKVMGTIVFGLGGLTWAIALLAFFVSSSALTQVFKSRKRSLSEKYAKGGQRDAGQVLGNGGLPTLFVLLHIAFPVAIWPWLGFCAALAAVTADTWATELGVLNPSPPRLITDLGKVVEKGTSGGVSPIGTTAALAGAALIGVIATTLEPSTAILEFGLSVTLGGLAGALFDSFMGATVQAIYRCPACDKETERYPTHTCGAQTEQVRGWKRLNNDWVNFACGAFGVLVTAGVYLL
jgi:uncharacterized protein (TIGR00297 family)